MRKTNAIQSFAAFLDDKGVNRSEREKLAAEIVEHAIKIGMRPPSVSEEDRQALMTVYYAGYTFNQWDEDLEKDEKVQEAKKRKQEAKLEREKKRKIKQLE